MQEYKITLSDLYYRTKRRINELEELVKKEVQFSVKKTMMIENLDINREILKLTIKALKRFQ